MFIQTEETPNPETLKFIPGEDVLGEISSVYYKDIDSAKDSPLAQNLFNISGVTNVYLASDFLFFSMISLKIWKLFKLFDIHSYQ